jgi:Holliday junction resolvase-like predicted endonuclease
MDSEKADSKKEAMRKKALGELGELVALKTLVDNGFEKISHLNDIKRRNYPFADLLAEKNGKKYAISVKARNKFQKNGALNSRYNLKQTYVASVENELVAEAYWMAIQFDKNSYSVRFGSVVELKDAGGRPLGGIPMGEDCVYGEEWVKDKHHYFDFSFFTNQN